jgi:TolB-like protein/Tfp pilus assembly protein PilF
VQQVAEELGVRYVLEGSIQKEGQRVRITAQLIDAISGRHVWAERYDRGLKDIFALQDEITIRIITELRVKLTDGEQTRLLFKGTENLSAYLKYLQAWEHFQSHTKENNASARRLLEEAIAIDPEFPQAYTVLGATYWMDIYLGSSKSPKSSLKKAVELNTKANSLNDSIPVAISHRGWLHVMAGEHDKAIADCELAISLAPNSANAHIWMGYALRYAGRHEEAVRSSERALRLNPIPRSTYFRSLGLTYIFVGRYADAIAVFNKALIQSPNDLLTHFSLACVYSLAGRDEDAHAAAQKVLKINPNFSVKHWEKRFTYKNKADKELIVGAASKAGLPYEPPLLLPDKPSIAVLAFDNLSGDPAQEYFSDGIAENIITALSKVSELFVIARNSSFTYKGKPVKVQQISRELGVQYVLEGSVQKPGDRVRITAQLIDAKNGRHLWAENYDRDFKDILEIQDEITMKIVTSLRIQLSEGEQARIFEKQSKNIDVYLKIAQAVSLFRDGTEKSLHRFGQLGQEIIDIDPEISTGYRILGWYNWGLAMRGISPRESIKKSFKFAQKALTLDESESLSHGLLGSIYLLMRKYDKAIESGNRAVELDPNGAQVHGILGSTFGYAGHLDEGIAHLKQAIRLNPFPPYWYYFHLGRIYRQKGQYEDALTEYKKSLQRNPDSYITYLGLAIIYVLLEHQEEAEAAAKKVIELNPKFSIARDSKAWPYKPADLKIVVDAMRKAGLPE